MTVRRNEEQLDLLDFDDGWPENSRHKFVVVTKEQFDRNYKVVDRWYTIDHYTKEDGDVYETPDVCGRIDNETTAHRTADLLNTLGQRDIAHLF